MARFICDFDKCEATDTSITVITKPSRERVRFCCAEHAARYLLRKTSLKALDRVMEDFGVTPG